MKRFGRIAAVVAVVAAFGTPAAAQRALIVSVYGGGADHLADLQSSPPVWFMPGYNVGASVGVQLSPILALHGDFTFTRNPVRGSGSFAGTEVNRFYYGAHLEARYPLSIGLAPFVFGGAGAVSVDQLGVDQFQPFTRPALMYGGGVFYAVPRSRVELFGEIKGLTYKWSAAGFDRTMFDVTYSLGASFRLPIGF
jgi:outer membrane protein with beta-barrel domain